ncbi:hypothetical protein MNEG_8988 [Monoraphidium neglectum]|uniref:Uncharacterized protein n=1 Tax=Monoraphidium neglectum TaxID=145388 RepID=A0A0D2KU59_9CHLO|nr:hypothetical protein MNEG_8988 [Monoraphidium neglectum]KIY98973.1 hypothetical protein MNEG_8988 [Monoraphidium neglectum]|eukprot:XP_013897993.1 hypothetical protein MNEG_8988 [Monoraphidium neglectum]
MSGGISGGEAGSRQTGVEGRAKRLKKLNRMFTSSTAQSATVAFRQRTWLITNAHGTATMARATDRFQLSAMRCNILQKCGLSEFGTFDICSPASVEFNKGRLLTNTMNLRLWHQELYLGATGTLAHFRDPRLYEYWTKKPLPEIAFVDLGSGTYVRQPRNETLWTMGNKYISASWDIYYLAPTLKSALNLTTLWNYVEDNGPASIFQGYTWSLDTFVDYAWDSLGKLKVVLVVLLVVETLCVQMTCMGLLTLLIRAANAQHMHRFSVFLALPSATLRIMASRQLMVDDDCGAAEDDEELEGLDLGAGGDAGGATTTNGGVGEKTDAEKKNVRMAADVDAGDDEEEGAVRTTKSGKKGSLNARSAAAAAAAKKNKPTTFGGRVYRALFGWLETKVKVNGKKLLPNSTAVLRFMAPLVLWAAAVVVVFGVSFVELANLQGPLSSLNAAAHVTYRVSRVRLAGNKLALSESVADNADYRTQLLDNLATLRQEYTALLYGGRIPPVNPNVTFEAVAPASTFANEEFANLFFKTRSCLREVASNCFPPGHEFYDITHNGLDAMIMRWMDDYTAFAHLPDELAFANHTLYKFINSVGGGDMVEA